MSIYHSLVDPIYYLEIINLKKKPFIAHNQIGIAAISTTFGSSFFLNDNKVFQEKTWSFFTQKGFCHASYCFDLKSCHLGVHHYSSYARSEEEYNDQLEKIAKENKQEVERGENNEFEDELVSYYFKEHRHYYRQSKGKKIFFFKFSQNLRKPEIKFLHQCESEENYFHVVSHSPKNGEYFLSKEKSDSQGEYIVKKINFSKIGKVNQNSSSN